MMSLDSGTQLGRYEIRSPLGAGGMGEVYLAQDTKLKRTIALKILPADVAGNRDRVNRFVQEARAASSLNHPNIAHIKAKSARLYVPSYYLAGAYAVLGDKDQAFAWLEKDFEEHSSNPPYYAIDPQLDDLRTDPRFTDLLRRMGWMQ